MLWTIIANRSGNFKPYSVKSSSTAARVCWGGGRPFIFSNARKCLLFLFLMRYNRDIAGGRSGRANGLYPIYHACKSKRRVYYGKNYRQARP
ncbi:MAG: hypothetical protein K2P33_12640, partial [Acutalibacter sp.]|nr:hypothetical protein [Acutalibacter sp.]